MIAFHLCRLPPPVYWWWILINTTAKNWEFHLRMGIPNFRNSIQILARNVRFSYIRWNKNLFYYQKNHFHAFLFHYYNVDHIFCSPYWRFFTTWPIKPIPRRLTLTSLLKLLFNSLRRNKKIIHTPRFIKQVNIHEECLFWRNWLLCWIIGAL